MKPKNLRRPQAVREFILKNARKHPQDITRCSADHFKMSRQAVLRHIRALVKEGAVIADGETRDRNYRLVPLSEMGFDLQFADGPKEDVVWRERIRPALEGIPGNVLSLCQYGFTEILNNAIEHSEGKKVLIALQRDFDLIQMWISDDGVGIFAKITRDLHLDDARHAILELSKGKLTTDPARHTGEGIFFASRMFDNFSILSGGLFFSRQAKGEGWLLDSEPSGKGTSVVMKISPESKRTTKEVFERFSVEPDSFAFNRTVVAVALVKYGDENLVSRSQARRLLARFERFEEVVLDFKGIETIGQAFADELFRVFPAERPKIHLVSMNAAPQVEQMIKRARNPT